jgi:hypothetical protein
LIGANAKLDPVTNGNDVRYATAIGAGAVAKFSDLIVIGKAAGTYEGVARPADIVRTAGIFQPALAEPGGSPVCLSSGLSICSSSRRYKKNIQQYAGGLDVLNRLNPITFEWTSSGRRDVGFVAEDVFQVEPLLTFKNDGGEIEGVHYAQISTVLVNAIKEQQAHIDAQAEELRALRAELRGQQLRTDLLLELLCGKDSQAEVCKK